MSRRRAAGVRGTTAAPQPREIFLAAGPVQSRLQRYLPWVLIAALLPVLFHNVFGWANLLTYPGEANFGEGVLWAEINRLADGGRIYTDPEDSPYWLATYPPLYHVVSLPGAGTVWFSRLVSLLSGLFAALGLSIALKKSGAFISAAVLAALLWLNSPFTDAWFALARVDMLGRALQAAAVLSALLIPGRVAAMVAALIFSTAAMADKQTMISGGLTCAGIFLLQNWRAGLLFTGCWAVLVAGLYAVLTFTTDGWFWNNAFTGAARSYEPTQLLAWGFGFLETHWPLLIPGVVGSIHAWKHEQLRWLLIALVAGVPHALLAGNTGSDRNYFFDVIWPLAGLAAVGIAAAGQVAGRALSSALSILCGLSLLVWAGLLMAYPTAYPDASQRKAAAEIVEAIKMAGRMPVLAELPGYPELGTAPAVYLPYMLAEKERAGSYLPPSDFVKAIEDGNYSAVLLTPNALARLGSTVLAAVEKGYSPAKTWDRVYFVEGEQPVTLLLPHHKISNP